MTWFWLALSAAVLWGLGYTINQATLKHFSTTELLLFECMIAFVVFGIYFIWWGDWNGFLQKLSNPKQFGLIMSSSLIYVVASILILKSINASNASLAAIIESCYPIFTVVFAFILFGELQLNLLSIIGFILILSGIVVVKLSGH